MWKHSLASSLFVLACLVDAPIGAQPQPQGPAQPSSPAPSPAESDSVQSPDELFLFFPSKYPEGNWAPSELKYEDVKFEAADKTQLHGWYCPCESPRAVVLIAHGNAGNVAMRAPLLLYLQRRLRVASFMFDYRGYGRSGGTPTVRGALLDAQAARDQLCRRAGVTQEGLVLMGESLGGAIAVQLAAESPPRGLILQSTFPSLRDVAAVHFPKLAWLVPTGKLNSLSAISQYHGPLLISHGERDQTVPFALGKKLFEAAHPPKHFFIAHGADHNDWWSDRYERELDRFIESLPKASGQ